MTTEKKKEKKKEKKEIQNTKTNKIYLEFSGHWFATSIESVSSINSIWELPSKFNRYIP